MYCNAIAFERIRDWILDLAYFILLLQGQKRINFRISNMNEVKNSLNFERKTKVQAEKVNMLSKSEKLIFF